MFWWSPSSVGLIQPVLTLVKGFWATATFFSTSWENIEVFHLWSMGSCQIRAIPSVHFGVGQSSLDSTVGVPWKASFQSMGISLLEGTSICPFHWFGFPCFLVHVVISRDFNFNFDRYLIRHQIWVTSCHATLPAISILSYSYFVYDVIRKSSYCACANELIRSSAHAQALVRACAKRKNVSASRGFEPSTLSMV